MPSAPPHAIAAAVDPLVGTIQEGIANEFLGGQLRGVEISLGETIAADAQLAATAVGNWLQLFIEHVHARVLDGAANRNRLCLL